MAKGLERRSIALLTIGVAHADHFVGRAVVPADREWDEVIDIHIIRDQTFEADRLARIGAFACNIALLVPEPKLEEIVRARGEPELAQ